MTAKGKTTAIRNLYQIKVTLKGSKPPIWRRFEVTGDITLDKLHLILQVVMGWQNYHLHQFKIGHTYYGEPSQEFDFEVKNEKKVQLQQVAPREKTKFIYEYDFGDSWEHELRIEKILPPPAEKHYPTCLNGARACPPEDVGGIWGYEDFLEIINDPEDPDHEELLEWIGGSFDPEAFDLAAINQSLKKLR